MTRGQHLAAPRARQLQLARRARLLEALHWLPAAALFALLLELERRYDLVDLVANGALATAGDA